MNEREGRGVIIVRNEARRTICTAGPADLVATATPTHSFVLQMSNYIQLDYRESEKRETNGRRGLLFHADSWNINNWAEDTIDSDTVTRS